MEYVLLMLNNTKFDEETYGIKTSKKSYFHLVVNESK